MERVKTFVNGGREYPADLNSIQDRAAEMLEDTLSAIPSSHFAGRFYRTTDTNQVFLDNGTEWGLIGQLNVKLSAVGLIAKPNEMVVITGSGETCRLPAASAANTTVGFFALGGELIVKTTGGEHINGDFLAETATSCKLTKFQHILVQYDGVQWLIVAGEPKREQLYSNYVSHTQVEMAAGVEISPTRPAFVSIAPNGSGSSGITITVGGREAALSTEKALISSNVWVNPGQKILTGCACLLSTVLL
jgi:hypothetical protein